MACFELFRGRYVSAAIGGLISGIIFGAAMVLFTRRGLQVLERQGIDAGDLKPIQEREIGLHVEAREAFELSRKALLAIPTLRIEREDSNSGEIHARTRSTMRSFGEHVTVRIRSFPWGEAQVCVRSEPRVQSTVVDFGKGVENVELFARELHRHGT